jgi:hypothetical protein
LQGLGGALVSPAALSIITTTFAEGEDRTKALGVWSAIAAGGGAFGLLLGGILTDLLSWEWIFFVNVPIGIATAVLALRYVPESRATNREPGADLPGAITVTAGLIVLVYAIVKAEDFGWGSSRTLGLAAIAFALLGAFVLIESRTRAPLIRLGIFAVRSLAGANGVLLIVMGGLFGFFFFSTLYVQLILGYSPLEAGLAFLPVTVGIGIGAGIAQQLVKRLGVRTTACVGMLIAADRDDERRRGGRGPRVGAVQHGAAGRRRARARGPLHPRRRQDHERPVRSREAAVAGRPGGRAARRLPGRVHGGHDPRRGRRGGACADRAQARRRERQSRRRADTDRLSRASDRACGHIPTLP